MGWLSDTFGGVGDAVGDVFGGVKDAGNWLSDNVWEPVGDFAGNAGDWVQNMGEFGVSTLQDDWNKLRKNPTSLAMGFDPMSAKISNKTFGTDYKPYVSVYGGPTQENFQNAESRGIDTSNAQGADQIGRFAADRAADYFTGGWGSGALHTADAYANDGDWKTAGRNAVRNYATNQVTQGVTNGMGMSDVPVNGVGDFANNVGNAVVRGGINAGLQGDSITQGAQQGAYGGLTANAGKGIGQMYRNYSAGELPDVGTLGGSARNEYGDSAADLGGYSPTQQAANTQAQGAGVGSSYGLPSNFQLNNMAQQGGGNREQAQSAGNPANDFIGAFMGGSGKIGGLTAGNYGDIGTGLMSLYNYRKTQRGLQDQVNSLSGMYGQNSPYSQVLRQQLERKDAAGGRRSQYGPREVELQARLAELASRNAPAIGAAQDRMSQNRAQGLAQLYKYGQKYGPGIANYAQNTYQNFNPGQNYAQTQSSGTLNSLYGNEGYGG